MGSRKPEMKLHTTAETINFARELEEWSAKFYSDLAGKHPQHHDICLLFTRENKRNIQEVKRAYYEVITDAIEGGFAFDIETDSYSVTAEVPAGMDYLEALQRAIKMEDMIAKFYSDAAEQSKALMADIPRALMKVAKGRQTRIAKLKLLYTSQA